MYNTKYLLKTVKKKVNPSSVLNLQSIIHFNFISHHIVQLIKLN